MVRGNFGHVRVFRRMLIGVTCGRRHVSSNEVVA
jgi:hypothetical protein